MVPKQQSISDMAQLASGLCSTFGFLCCLLFLPASWEAGATTAHALQKTGESSTSLPVTPGLIHRSPSSHADLNSRQQPTDLPKSVATPKPKRRCNTTRRAKPLHSTDDPRATVHTETPLTTTQREDPVIRSGRAVDDANSTDAQTRSSDRSHPTSVPRSKTTCKSTTGKTRVTRNSATTERPEETETSSGTSAHKATVPSHDSEINRKNTSSSVKPTDAHLPTSTPSASKGTEDHETPFASDEPHLQTTKHVKGTTSAIEHEGATLSASEKVMGVRPMSIESEGTTVSASERTTGAHSVSTESETVTISSSERTTGVHLMSTESEGTTTLANENMTHISISEKSTEHPEETTATIEKVTRVSQTPTVFQRKTTGATQTTKATENSEKTAALKTTHPVAKVTEGKHTTTCHPNKTKTTHQGPIGTLTSRMNPRSITSGAPGNRSHTQQDTHSSSGGLQAAGVMRENNSFPAWAIVIVVLVAVILLLIFIGLIFLVSCASRTRHTLTQNAEDNDPEDHGGRNSYPVYLMEQQNLNLNQTPYPR